MALLKTRAKLAENAPYTNLDLINMVDTQVIPLQMSRSAVSFSVSVG